MASPMFSNNAPPPIPGGYGNPTGANTGGFASNTKDPMAGGFPNMPALGPIAKSASAPASGLNNPGPYGGATVAGLSSLSTGITPTDPTLQGNQLREYQRAYGKGTGQAIFDMMQKGLFNPQVAQAMLAAQQPGIQRGQADILNAFGRGGSRFSSSAALGLGDFNSQVQLNQGQILASMYQNAQNSQLNFLGNTLGDLHTEEANNGGGWIDDLVGGLEIAGGIIGAPFTGGLSLGLVGSGASMLAQGLGGKGGGGSPTVPWQNVGTQSPKASQNANEVPAFATNSSLINYGLASSAGEQLGGAPVNQDQMFQAFPNF